jgi:hypothetical protein
MEDAVNFSQRTAALFHEGEEQKPPGQQKPLRGPGRAVQNRAEIPGNAAIPACFPTILRKEEFRPPYPQKVRLPLVDPACKAPYSLK